jgi:hypothetical protein
MRRMVVVRMCMLMWHLWMWQARTYASAPEPKASVADAASVANDGSRTTTAETVDSETCLYIDETSGACRTECADLVDDVEECLQLASLGKCSVEGDESKALKRRCPKACRTCWSCDNIGGEDTCKGRNHVSVFVVSA